MGTRQTGAINLKIADLARDVDLLEAIQQTTEQILIQAPQAIQPLCDRWLGASTEYAEV